MIPKPVIHTNNLPRTSPFHTTVTVCLFLKVFNCNAYIIGATVLALLYVWFLYIKDVLKVDEKTIDIFTNYQIKPKNVDKDYNVRGEEISSDAD